MEDLPAVIVADILSRLPIKTILHSRCVCKTWRSLLYDSSFAKQHLSRSPTSFMILHKWGIRTRLHNPDQVIEFHDPGFSTIVQLENDPDYSIPEYPDPGFLSIVQVEEDETNRHNFRHVPLLRLELTLGFAFRKSQLLLVGSVNGWLCLWQNNRGNDNTLICNPLTREYMILPRQEYYRQSYAIIVYGFGCSLSTGQYKVVRIFQGDIPAAATSGNRPSLLEAEVYTLGTRKWRSLGHVPYWLDGFHGPFLNGFVHWLIIDRYIPENICSFDMEKESFHLFPSPPKSREVDLLPGWNQFQTLGVIRGCLCKCDVIEFGLDIWVMKEYGSKKSWTKDLVVRDSVFPNWQVSDPVYVRKGLKDGTILFTSQEDSVFSYCAKRNSVKYFEMYTGCINAMDYAPSFLRLGNFEQENVHVF